MHTSVDCYVAGSYIGRDGATVEIKQRYTIYVSYNRLTQRQAMNKVHSVIIEDFGNNFPSFHVTDVFIPEHEFIVPLGASGLYEPEAFYYGSDLFKRMSRQETGRFRVGLERDIFQSRMRQIKKQFKMR